MISAGFLILLFLLQSQRTSSIVVVARVKCAFQCFAIRKGQAQLSDWRGRPEAHAPYTLENVYPKLCTQVSVK